MGDRRDEGLARDPQKITLMNNVEVNDSERAS